MGDLSVINEALNSMIREAVLTGQEPETDSTRDVLESAVKAGIAKVPRSDKEEATTVRTLPPPYERDDFSLDNPAVQGDRLGEDAAEEESKASWEKEQDSDDESHAGADKDKAPAHTQKRRPQRIRRCDHRRGGEARVGGARRAPRRKDRAAVGPRAARVHHGLARGAAVPRDGGRLGHAALLSRLALSAGDDFFPASYFPPATQFFSLSLLLGPLLPPPHLATLHVFITQIRG